MTREARQPLSDICSTAPRASCCSGRREGGRERKMVGGKEREREREREGVGGREGDGDEGDVKRREYKE